MTHAEMIFLASQVSLLVGMFLMVRRVNRVEEMRREMIKKVFAHMDWERRFTEMKKVSFDRMCATFWKPVKLEAYYKDLSFLADDEGKMIDGAVLSPFHSNQTRMNRGQYALEIHEILHGPAPIEYRQLDMLILIARILLDLKDGIETHSSK